MLPDALGPSLHQLCRALCTHPKLAHVRPEALLFVAAQARRASAATIRPLFFSGGRPQEDGLFKPIVRMNGQRMRYEIALRPPFFRRCSPRRRLEILVHELWHIAPDFDGSLASERRHTGQNETCAPFVQEVLQQTELAVAADFLSLSGVSSMQAWLHRPPTRMPADEPRLYTEAELYLQPVELCSIETET